jgi:hypothetical protein
MKSFPGETSEVGEAGDTNVSPGKLLHEPDPA